MVDVEKALSIENNYARYKHVKSILIKGTEDTRKRVSICIPTYNRVDTLKETIESCLNQVNYDDFLIIISDNNPTRNDETELYVQSLNASNILYYKHEQNIGMYGNLNRLYELSKSDYTVCVHDDDILMPHFLDICFNVIDNNDSIEFLYPDKIAWNPDSENLPIEMIPEKALLYKMTYWDFIAANPCPPTGMLIKTSVMKKLGGYDYDTYPSNDYYFNVKSLYHGDIYRLSCGLLAYRMGANTTVKRDTILGFMRVDPPLTRWILKDHPIMKCFYSSFMLVYSFYWVNYFKENHPGEPISDVDMDIVTEYSYLKRKGTTLFKLFFRFLNNTRHKIEGKSVYIKSRLI